MIYVETSVVLAQVLGEGRRPHEGFWERELVTSRLTSYETWTQLHGRDLSESHGARARAILGRCDLVELWPVVLERALEPFPIRVRTLDALHLASVAYLRATRGSLHLATYDRRVAEAASAMDIPVWEEGS